MGTCCRICLSKSVDKDIRQLKSTKNQEYKSYSQILAFCLDIQVTDNPKITTKLCLKCYKKIVTFYKFKLTALKNDVYLRSVHPDDILKLEVICDDDDENEISDDNNNDELTEDETKIKIEEVLPTLEAVDSPSYDSGDELLSIIKEVKDESDIRSPIHTTEDIFAEDFKENDKILCSILPSKSITDTAPVKEKGRPKKTTSKPFKKQLCGTCGKTVSDLPKHARKHLPLEDRRSIKCKQCDQSFCSHAARYRHVRTKHLGIKYPCDVCGKEVTNLRAHKLRKHERDSLKHPCVLCEHRFLSQSLLDQHMLVHTKERPYECDVCEKKFRLKVTMLLHKRQVHDKEKTHLCQFCSKSFFKKYHLTVHLRSHTKEKPYKCTECGRGFSCTNAMRHHMATHSAVKNFQCDHCSMAFICRDYLRAHMVIHTKVKNYPCKYCGVRFGRSDHRKRHQFTAHEKHLLAA